MNDRKTAELPGFSARSAVGMVEYPALGRSAADQETTPEFMSQILGPEKARKPHDSLGFCSVHAQNLPTNSVEEAHFKETSYGSSTEWSG
jgi:hypothetical protein